MATRRHLVFVLAGVFLSMGASFRTTNFVVDAPTPQLAQQFGQAAEQYRKDKALQWLGQEMPPWPEPCPVQVKVTMGGAGGATSFAFDRGRVLGQHMNIEGSLDRLLVSVLPHEVTHTVFAYYYRCPVPRWADEGGAVLSEDDVERDRHDRLCRQILNTPGRAIPLRRLFSLKDYPNDVMALYAQGFSVSNFLVSASSRPAFLAFVADGMRRGWDAAAQTHYHYNNVEELENAWLTQLRNTRRPQSYLAQNTAPAPAPSSHAPASLVRQTLPPIQPVLAPPAPIFRGQAPGPEQETEVREEPARRTAAGPGGYLPDYTPVGTSSSIRDNPPPPAADGWQPAGSQPYHPPTVRLGAPQAFAAPLPTLRPPAPSAISPVGYPF